MSLIGRMQSLLRKNKVKVKDTLEHELQFHLEKEIEQNVLRGMSAEEARRRALIAFGGVQQTRENVRRVRWTHFGEVLAQDLRYAWRMLRKSAGFTTVAVLTLALGIGANTAIFSAVYSVLLKPLPFKNPDQLVAIWKRNPPRGWSRNPISAAEFLAWRDQNQAFVEMAVFRQMSCVLIGSSEPEEDPCEIVSSNLFSLLGVSPVRGRNFLPDEDQQGAAPAAILSYGLWQRRFGADEDVIGRTIELNGASYAVVGVMPAAFSHLYASPYSAIPELWVSGIKLSAASTWNDYLAIGRLKPGITLQGAQEAMDPVSARIAQIYPDLKGWQAQLTSFRVMASGDGRALLVLMGAVTFVLLIACANVANLLLARGASRAGEFAVRKALGASHGRLVRQLLTESLLISLAGGVLGVLLAWWGSKGLAALAPPYLVHSAPGLANAAFDVRVLAFAFATALVTTVLCGLAPANQSGSPQVAETLKETTRGSMQSPRSRRLRNVLVVSEIALAMVLLVGAGLMIRTLAQLSHVNLGFDPTNVLTIRVPFSGARYREPQAIAEFWRRVLASVEALPGVQSASVSRGLPIDDWAGQFFTTADRPNPPAGQVPDANYVVVGPHYFKALHVPLRLGRSFDENDTHGTDPVVIVNEELARLYWPGQNPLGRRLRMGAGTSKEPWLSVVGVVSNVLSQGTDTGVHAEVFVPYQQFPWVLSPQHLVLRTAASVKPESLARAVVGEVHRVDKDQPAADIRTLEQVAFGMLAQQRMVMALLGAFAGLALVLSALGIYSVLSYSVAQRTREIGVRMALGAQRGDVMRLVAGIAAHLAILGIAGGIAAALALTQLMTDLLYGVRATDPVTFGATAVVLAATALLACYIPARRATRIDPLVALRHE